MRFLKTISTGLAVALGVAVFAAPAQADRYRGYYWGHGGANNYWRHPGYRHGYYRHPYRYDRDYYYGGAVAAGVLGFATGAIVGSAAAPRYYAPAPGYYGGSAGASDWIAACSAKYKSFNPSTGNYLGYDGQYHRCNLQ